MQVLMLVRRGREGEDDESEPVTVEVRGHNVVLVLDDGEELVIDRRELLNAALEDAA